LKSLIGSEVTVKWRNEFIKKFNFEDKDDLQMVLCVKVTKHSSKLDTFRSGARITIKDIKNILMSKDNNALNGTIEDALEQIESL